MTRAAAGEACGSAHRRGHLRSSATPTFTGMLMASQYRVSQVPARGGGSVWCGRDCGCRVGTAMPRMGRAIAPDTPTPLISALIVVQTLRHRRSRPAAALLVDALRARAHRKLTHYPAG